MSASSLPEASGGLWGDPDFFCAWKEVMQNEIEPNARYIHISNEFSRFIEEQQTYKFSSLRTESLISRVVCLGREDALTAAECFALNLHLPTSLVAIHQFPVRKSGDRADVVMKKVETDKEALPVIVFERTCYAVHLMELSRQDKIFVFEVEGRSFKVSGCFKKNEKLHLVQLSTTHPIKSRLFARWLEAASKYGEQLGEEKKEVEETPAWFQGTQKPLGANTVLVGERVFKVFDSVIRCQTTRFVHSRRENVDLDTVLESEHACFGDLTSRRHALKARRIFFF